MTSATRQQQDILDLIAELASDRSVSGAEYAEVLECLLDDITARIEAHRSEERKS